jgi:hypothetical protein
MMEAPVLPARPYYETDVNRVVRGPGPSNAARRFAVIAGAASLAIVGAAIAVRAVGNPGTAGATVAAPQQETGTAPTTVGIVVQTVPAGAEVLRDGMPVGTTPMVLKVPAGTRATTLTLRKQGFEDEVRPVQPTVDPNVTVTLRPVAPVEPSKPADPEPTKKVAGSGDSGEHKAHPKRPKVPVHADDILEPKF